MSADPPPVEDVVVEVIRNIVGKDRNFTLSSNFTQDLRICTDDASFYVIPELERRFKVYIPQEELDTVYTVRDLCDAIRRHLSDATKGKQLSNANVERENEEANNPRGWRAFFRSWF